MNIFEYYDYRLLVKDSLKERKVRFGQRYTYNRMAEYATIQNTYLSGAINQKLHLNSEQLYACLLFLKHDESEIQFIMDLHTWQRAGESLFKEQMERKINQARKNALKTESTVNVKKVEDTDERIQAFYLDPLCQLIHMFLTIDAYKVNPNAISKELNISQEELNLQLEKINKAGLVTYTGSQISEVKKDLHLSESSPIFRAYRNLMRAYSLPRIQTSAKRNHGFSVLFSADDEAFAKIRKEFNQFTSNIKEIVEASKETRVYQLNFDLFDWHSRG